ncbi:M1 family metallopeptidase [Flavilitoribacter nigricans]|uniref:Aminopeptidase N n=1 Tax=Flavilitoribacter nigricans (strain ATCC 23147 / DSM 23189 / NBRC 102662 / NCIMB 1420 / SS-2) TaxID=1122177 RepID=A0A2D0NHP6_FLAN2|nr:M1 family metallopeptidase [Flavilitoribacter nigricans]PHN08001.1 metallopeptidase [Flavilitoribacter nigricans DSM 23189 = NBRC 102662]
MKRSLPRPCWFVLFLFSGILSAFAQNQIPRLDQIDVQHYQFQLALSDATDEIRGKAEITIKFLQPLASFDLDLVAYRETEETGMKVEQVRLGEQSLSFEQSGEKLTIQLPTAPERDSEHNFSVSYRGIPADGLIIDANKFGHRTFFGDNWPNRAHHWLPSVDHPSDKASVEFIVTAPEHYQVIGNGVQVEETNLLNGLKLTHWREDVPLPTKVMVIGAADFAVQRAGAVMGIPITSWVYPENRQAGFFDYGQALDVLPFFIERVGPYSYSKLANVQSKTRYGGMENASNIFYYENSVNGRKEQESLITHEIAHQWFGNSASEGNWHHVWLSEGFATYFTILYFEYEHSAEAAREMRREDRDQIINFAASSDSPIIDTRITDYNDLLNTNSYQKGGWVLHMLRRKIGDDAFWRGIREYYTTYRNGNALSEDLQRIMEKAGGQDLDTFFEQWLYRPGLPILEVQLTPGSKRNKHELRIRQTQEGAAFEFPLKIDLYGVDGNSETITVDVRKKEESQTIKFKGTIERIEIDPEVDLLVGETP